MLVAVVVLASLATQLRVPYAILLLTYANLVELVVNVALGLAWPVAFVLEMLVSPIDAVAASAIVQQLGVARRAITIGGRKRMFERMFERMFL